MSGRGNRRDIVVGRAVVPYAEAVFVDGNGFIKQTAGWVLPGGERTADPERARAAAEAMHRLLSQPKAG